MAAIALREDYDATEVRRLASKVKDADQARRLLAIAAVYAGMSREAAARIGGMDRQTLRDWVHRFNAEGPGGLVNRKAPGAARRLSETQRAELVALVEAGPDPAIEEVVRWRCIDLQALIHERFGVSYTERHVGKLLKALGFSHISPRPRPAKQDPATLDAFKKTSPPVWTRS
jgi:transposase